MPPLDESGEGTHEERTTKAVRAALTTVPFYVKQPGLSDRISSTSSSSSEGSLAEMLAKLPLLTRDKIRPTLPKAWFPEGRDAKAELAAGSIAVVEIGTGESRLRVLFDRSWSRQQEKRALSLHPRAEKVIAGEHGAPYRDAVLWVPERGTGSCGSGDPAYEERLEGGTRLHLNSRQDPTFWTEPVMTRMLDEIAVHETTALLADPFYLDVLARHAAILNRRLDVRGFVATMRARATTAHRDMLARVFPGTVIDVLAAREVGVLFVEGADRNMHHAAVGSTHVELLPAKVETPGAANVALVVVTTLDRAVQPLVRYVLGDMVQIAPDAEPNKVSGVPAISSVEGTLDDAIVRPDGAIVTSGAIDRAIGTGARAYQVVQTGGSDVELEVIGGDPNMLRDSLASSLFAGMKVSARAVTAIGAESNGKYRTSRRAAGVAVTLPSWS